MEPSMSDDFKDIAALMKQKKAQQAQKEEANKRPFDPTESYQLRGKMLGVLIRDARVNAARTIEDCARLLNVTPEVVQAWEFGEQVPNLPQLELLAYYLDVPISHFWGQKTLNNDPTNKRQAQDEYLQLRQRMIGALLRQAREERGLTVEALAEASYLLAENVENYESGALPIPMHELTVLADAVNKNLDYFLETSSYIGELLRMRKEWQHFADLDEETRAFAANPVNIGFIQIAIMFSKMPVENLRKVAEGMLEITM
jgi:transcriptional regulator with XRE-family HTH domain